ncbi:MAG: Asp-tRNA(Asn)/Glu-tRNA(Gln) amidotransferase subunit GatC [Gammaproteobacteria bacterium]|jgi:aspartyl-tRNA(Asn)/glutamyl-tRNA(Gln) amidotransferase subunit C
MSLTPDDVQKIAHLAKLGVSDEEASAVAGDLTNILNLVEQMQQVDTTDVLPMSHPLHMTQRLRPDEVSESNQRDKFQSIAPATENGLYLVPKVIE